MLSVRTTTCGNSAKRKRAWLNCSSGCEKATKTNTFRADINSSHKSFIDCSSGIFDEGMRVTKRSRTEGISISCVSGSETAILIWTGPFSPDNDVNKASFIQRLKYHPSIGRDSSARKLYERFTKWDKAPYCRNVWLSSWSIHSIGRSAEITINGICW